MLSFHFLDLYHIFSYFPSELVALFPISALKDKVNENTFNEQNENIGLEETVLPFGI